MAKAPTPVPALKGSCSLRWVGGQGEGHVTRQVHHWAIGPVITAAQGLTWPGRPGKVKRCRDEGRHLQNLEVRGMGT